MYRNNIEIDNKYTFGVEIEFSNVDIYNIYSKLLEDNIPVSYVLNHSEFDLEYDVWYIDIDSTVTDIIGDKFIGGELSSRILSDNIYTWNEINDICNKLIKNGAFISSNCATHVNIDVSTYKDLNKFIENLYKILLVYEKELNIFYMGDKYYIRDTKNVYASNLGKRLLSCYNDIDFNGINILDDLFYKNLFQNFDGINFEKLGEKGLIEVRYPNGTLDSKVIQNYINFTIKLFLAINKELFDIDKLNYIINNIDYNYFDLSNTDLSLFMDLVSTISTNSLDEEDFFSQYKKIKTY